MSDNSNPLKLHHAILKAAHRRGFVFVGSPGGKFRMALLSDETKLSSEIFDSTAEALEAFDNKEVEFVSPKQEKPVSNGKCGIMSASHHSKYSNNPHGPGSNDELDCAMRSAFSVAGIDKVKTKIDTEALMATGLKNEVWNDAWNRLNPGLQRMNLANRLRAKLRNGTEDIYLCDKSNQVVSYGRYGIGYKADKLIGD